MYAKLFSRITESSLMEQEIPVRYTFVMLLAIADPTGLVIGTDIAIARRFNMPLKQFKKCMNCLEAPDKDSNSKEMQGRRVILSEGERGYQIVNYTKYKAFKDEESRRDYMRRYMRDYRSDREPVNAGSLPSFTKTNPSSASASASISSSDSVQGVGTGRGLETRKPSSVEEVIEKGKFIGVSEQDCRNWFRDCQACNWTRGDGTPFDNWPRQFVIHRDKTKSNHPQKLPEQHQMQETINVKTLCTKPLNKPPTG